LAQALERAGQMAEANSVYEEFQRDARGQMESANNANASLVSYCLGHRHDSAEALRIARIAISKHHDVGTLDAYAWALHANALDTEAQQQIAKALAIGVRDAAIFYHAGAIAQSLSDNPTAARLLKSSLDLNPSSEVSAAARDALEKLTSASAEAQLSK
jgi:hypothetical protein